MNSNNRLVQWRSKPLPEFNDMQQQASELKLFLVSETGPTSFTFRDEDGNNFKLSIGQEIKCSCRNTIKEHCLHTLFVMIKKFRVQQNHQILYQGSYVDSEIQDLLCGKYQEQNKDIQKKKFLTKAQKNKQGQVIVPAKEDQHFRKQIDEESICPICQENINEDEPLTFCRKKCGNNYHIKCLKYWIEHKQSQDDKITCPMCRTDLGGRVMEELKKDEYEYNHKFELHQKKCKGCGKKPIIGQIFHCLICENVDLCLLCYESLAHMQHNKFLTKQKNNDEWKIPNDPDRSRARQQQVDIYQQFQQQQQNMQQQQLLQVQQSQFQNKFASSSIKKYTDMTQYYLSCFEENKNEQEVIINKNVLSVVGYDINRQKKECAQCRKAYGVNQGNMLKQLNCNHCLDEPCLIQLIVNKTFECPICNQPILKGLESANGLGARRTSRKENMEEKQQQTIANTNSAVNSQTMKKQQQLNQQKKKYLSQSSSKKGFQATLSDNSNFEIQGSSKIQTGQDLTIISTQQQLFQRPNQQNFQMEKPNSQQENTQNQKKVNNFRIKKHSKPPMIRQNLHQQQVHQLQILDLNINGGGVDLNQRNHQNQIQQKRSLKNQENNYQNRIRSGGSQDARQEYDLINNNFNE